MAAASREIPRSDVVGSLLRPAYLKEARRDALEGKIGEPELRVVEDRAVREAIALQESAGLDVITDGEFRRNSWVVTIPLREVGAPHAPLGGYEFLPADPGWWSLWKEPDGRRAQVWTSPTRPFITKPLAVVRDIVADEYAFLKANARHRTKFTIPAPSWHRIFWHPQHSRDAYPTPEDFLRAVARYLREDVVARVKALGGDYVQMDAPNYAQWHVDADNRAAFEAWGHDMAAELRADAEIDNTVFDGTSGVTRAIHICRGNAPGGRWLANGGYERIAGEVFPRLTNYDRLLLEYDSPRAGDFGPLRHVGPRTLVVLGLLTTKQGALEDAARVETRIREAAQHLPLERLALSPQCGFASGEAGNPLTPEQQEAKLRLVGRLAQRVWR
ncbi:MAG TPA: cobalamin-independent methionine synthase II family protein [Methylomirabilota bacterium]|jgi:5-methyltetrahydropteroyltriglutamate--homocysteine methyltransferase|nr:cobalamin-independent methionine synthase II family protein [Methylomirabilota bacterium]